MKGENNFKILMLAETTLANTYDATFLKRKSSIIYKDIIKYQLPNKQIVKLEFRNNKLVAIDCDDQTIKKELKKIIKIKER
jgi:hypothetical protein